MTAVGAADAAGLFDFRAASGWGSAVAFVSRLSEYHVFLPIDD